jgi:outer membrane protein assembly factor BamB
MWYYALDGERHGPVDKSTIQDLIDRGDLRMDDFVWNSTMEDWKPISEVEDFHPSPPSLLQEEPSTPTSSRKEDSTGDHQTQAASDSEKSPDEETSSTSMRMWAVVAVVLVLVVLATALIQFTLRDGSNTDALSEEVRFKSSYVNWSIDWASSVDNHKSLNVTVSNFGIIFVGQDKRSLISLGSDDGSEIWRITTEDEISADLSHLHHMNVYAVAGKKLLAVNKINGDRRWESRTRSSISTSPVVRNGSVYLGTIEGKIYAFDSESGKKKWEASVLEGSVSALSATVPDQGGGHILFAGSGKTVVSLDERAEVKWQTKIEVGSVTTLDNTPSTYGETTRALYIGTDRELGGGVVYQISFDRFGPALNRPTVKERLKWEPSESSFPSPTIGTVLYSSDWLYVSTTDGLYALNVTAGGLNGGPSMEKAWVSRRSGMPLGHQHTPVTQHVNSGMVNSDRIIFGTHMGRLRSVISKVEKEFWRLEAKDGWIIPARGPRGSLYGVSHGEIYAIEQY